MKKRNLQLLVGWALAIGLVIAAQLYAQADNGYEPPRTANDYPDLQGTWTNVSVTRLTRPPGVDKLVVTPEEAKKVEESFIWNEVAELRKGEVDISTAPPAGDEEADIYRTGYDRYWLDPGTTLAIVKGEIRTSWIVEPEDGQIPYKEDGEKAQQNPKGLFAVGGYDGPEVAPLSERCLMSFSNAAGPVLGNGEYNNNYQIVQTEDHVMILAEMVHDARIIRIDGEHRPDVMKPWMGDSIGWYEGDTLVVETINPHPQQRAYITPEGKLIERFTRWSDNQILYEFEVTDPNLYTQPWRGEMSLNKTEDRVYEYACHEGNYSFPGTLAGARAEERDAEEAEAEK